MIYLWKLIKNIYFCSSITTVLIWIMINRVLIRLKIIQIVYAYYQNGSKNLDSAEKELFFSLSKAYDLYNYLLMLMIALTEYAQKRIDAAKAKLAPTKEELYPNRKFVDNKFIAQLEVNKQFANYGEKSIRHISLIMILLIRYWKTRVCTGMMIRKL